MSRVLRARVLFLSFLVFVAGLVLGDTALYVTGDRVNLRVSPSPTSEVVGQVSEGDVLAALDRTEGDWVAVSPPDSLDLWVYGELVQNGVSTVERLRVRGGPGINYQPVGTIGTGDALTVRGQEREWLRIAPPDGCVVWISSKYVSSSPAKADPVSPVVAPPPLLPALTEQQVAPVTAPAPEARDWPPPRVESVYEEPSPPPEPRRLVPSAPVSAGAGSDTDFYIQFLQRQSLVGSREQGVQVRLDGVLRPTGWASWNRPSRYRLVRPVSAGPAATLCYLLADESLLASAVGKRVVVSGRQFWLQGARCGVVAVEMLSERN